MGSYLKVVNLSHFANRVLSLVTFSGVKESDANSENPMGLNRDCGIVVLDEQGRLSF